MCDSNVVTQSSVWPIIRIGVSADNFFPLGSGLGEFLSKDEKARTAFKTTKVEKAVEKPALFAPKPKLRAQASEWACKTCTLYNKASSLICEVCSTSRTFEDDEEYAAGGDVVVETDGATCGQAQHGQRDEELAHLGGACACARACARARACVCVCACARVCRGTHTPTHTRPHTHTRTHTRAQSLWHARVLRLI